MRTNKKIRSLDSAPLGFFRPYRVSMTKVVSFWLIYFPACRLAATRFSLSHARFFRGAKKPILSWVSPSFRDFTNFCAVGLCLKLREPKKQRSTTLLSILFSSAHLARKAPYKRGCQLPRKSTLSVSTLSANRS